MVETSLRSYIGLTKETTKGTPVAPTSFPRWLDGTTLGPKNSMERVIEGDGGRDAAFSLKKLAENSPSIVTYPRPIEGGLLVAASMGNLSDSVSGSTPTSATTVASGATLASTAVTVASIGSITTNSIVQIGATGSGLEECVKVASVAGAVMTLSTGLRRAHANGVAVAIVAAPYLHALIPANTPDWYTIEAGLLSGTMGNRLTDAIIEELTIEGAAGQAIKFTTKWRGLTAARQISPATVVSESGLPWLYSGSVITLETGVSALVQKFKATLKNGIDAPQANKITVADLIWGRRTLDVEYGLLFTDDTLFRQMFYGGATGTTESQYVGNGSFDFLGYPGDLASVANTLEVSIPSVDLEGDAPPEDLAGKALVYNVKGYALHGTNPVMSINIKNGQYLPY